MAFQTTISVPLSHCLLHTRNVFCYLLNHKHLNMYIISHSSSYIQNNSGSFAFNKNYKEKEKLLQMNKRLDFT